MTKIEVKRELSVAEAGKLGGEKVRDEGLVDFSAIGKRGGTATAAKYGKEHFERIGQAGGRATSDKHGKGFYREIGALGGQRVRDLIEKGKASEEAE